MFAVCFVVLRSPSASFFKSLVYQRDSLGSTAPKVVEPLADQMETTLQCKIATSLAYIRWYLLPSYSSLLSLYQWINAIGSPPSTLQCSVVIKIIIILIIIIYFTHLPRIPQWVDLYQIWYTRSPRRRNQLCRIFCRLVQRYWFCRGLKFAYPHRNWRSPLTLPKLPFRLWLLS